jgi:hypothetical protein
LPPAGPSASPRRPLEVKTGDTRAGAFTQLTPSLTFMIPTVTNAFAVLRRCRHRRLLQNAR